MEKLAISFMIYGLYAENYGDFFYDVDRLFRETKERGFNCVRFDDGAGLICDPSGKERGTVNIHRVFGNYTHYVRQSSPIARDMRVNVKARLLKIFEHAKKHGIKLIPSSWFYLHTNWLTDKEINDELFELPTERKIEYFAEELDRVLTLARENGYIDTIAFAEIFNEFNGLPFAGEYKRDALAPAENLHLRDCHEKAISWLKSRHPDVLFAYDHDNAYPNPDLMPRNIDVLNCHIYYMWDVYHHFERHKVTRSLDEIVYDDEMQRYLYKEKTKVKDVIKEMGGSIRTGGDWPSRIALYSSIDPEKESEIEELLESALRENKEKYFKSVSDSVDNIVKIKKELLPNVKLVLGEGVTYCASNYLLWEEHSDLYWEMLARQSKMLKEKGFDGAVIRTTACPEDPSWSCRAEDMKKINEYFCN